MANCELRILGNPIPLAKINIDDTEGYIRWTYIPLAASGNMVTGKIRMEAKNSLLIIGPGKHAGVTFGTLINFNLFHFNRAITYTLLSGKRNFRCTIEGD